MFNYFARKEDLFIDREDEAMRFLREALHARRKGESPVDAIRGLVESLREEKHPFARIDRHTVGWCRVVAASPSLEARLREVGDEVVEGLARELSGGKPDGLARLTAGLIVTTWRTAYGEAIRVFERSGSVKKANATFEELIDRGFEAVRRVTK